MATPVIVYFPEGIPQKLDDQIQEAGGILFHPPLQQMPADGAWPEESKRYEGDGRLSINQFFRKLQTGITYFHLRLNFYQRPGEKLSLYVVKKGSLLLFARHDERLLRTRNQERFLFAEVPESQVLTQINTPKRSSDYGSKLSGIVNAIFEEPRQYRSQILNPMPTVLSLTPAELWEKFWEKFKL